MLTIFLLFSPIAKAIEKIPAGKVKFIQISDVHLHDKPQNLGSRMYAHSEELLADAIRQVNQVKEVDFVVFTGDMINRPDKSLFQKFVNNANELKVPWYCTTGNHDLDANRLSKKAFIDILKQHTGLNADESYYKLKKDKFVFLFMDGTDQIKNTANGFYSQKELSWLESQLKEHKNSYIVIFQHYPVVEPFRSNSHHVLNADKYLEILDKYQNVIALISGHYHAAKVNVRNKLAHISSPALVQYPNAFRLVTLENIDEYVFISLEFMPAKLEKVRNKSFHLINSVKLHAGTDKDQNTTIILHKPLPGFPAIWIR